MSVLNVNSIKDESKVINKKEWKDFLIIVELDNGRFHPVALELIGEARKMAAKTGYKVNCMVIGAEGTSENAEKLLKYGVDNVYVYEDNAFEGYRADCYTAAAEDCINRTRPSAVLIGATSLGRSLAPRIAARFKTGLTADCTELDINEDTDMVQIRPAFGGNIMAEIRIKENRPQFATVRYRVMDKAVEVDNPDGEIHVMEVTEEMKSSGIEILSQTLIEQKTAIEDAEIIVVAGRGVKNQDGMDLCRKLADALGGQVAFTRPMVELGIGDQLHQIGLSGHTVKPKLIITCGVSGAIQFTTCMQGADHIVAINSDPEARIFSIAHYCIVDDLYDVVPKLIEAVNRRKES